MGCAVVQQLNLVVGTGNDAVVHYNDGTHGHFFLIKCFLSFCKRQLHILFIRHTIQFIIYSTKLI